MAIFVDSTFYIDKQRARKDVRQLLASWLLRGELLSCGIVRAEVLRGILKPEIKEEMEEFFDLVPEIPTDSGASANEDGFGRFNSRAHRYLRSGGDCLRQVDGEGRASSKT